MFKFWANLKKKAKMENRVKYVAMEIIEPIAIAIPIALIIKFMFPEFHRKVILFVLSFIN